MTELLALGISHKTAPVALRERVAMTEGRAAGTVRDLVESDAVEEAVIISTCNRTEFYLASDSPVDAESAALGALARQAAAPPTNLAARLYSHRGEQAVRHLFEVTAGIDSVILGEAEIQGQVRRSYELALVEGGTGPILNRLFRDALKTGGKVRSETAIGRGGVSVSSVAIELAEQTLGNLDGLQVMLVGAGETARLVARTLDNRGARTAFIANRHHDRAERLAAEHGGEALSLETMRERLSEADLVISATLSPHHVLEPEHVGPACADSSDGALTMIDLAVPRDINPTCRELPGVTVFDFDDLEAVVERNAAYRARDLEPAGEIVAREAERFERWRGTLGALPTVAAMQRRTETVIASVLAENEGRWEGMTESDRARLHSMAGAIGRRLLDEPIRRIKSGSTAESEAFAATLQELFRLGPEPEDTVSAETRTDVTDLDARRRMRRGTGR